MSWLTDPDEEWSTDEPPAGGSGRPVEHPTADPGVPPSGRPGAPPPPTRPSYSAIPDGLWAANRPGDDEPGAGYHDFADYGEEQPRSRLGLIAAIVVGWLVVSIAVLGVLLVVRGPHGNTNKAGSPSSNSAVTSTRPPAPSSAAALLPDGWVKQAADVQTDCAAHSYGEVQAFFAKVPCSAVNRLLATTNQGGRPVIVASYVIRFKNDRQASQYNSLVTADGTGNISDLLREGATVQGGPTKLPAAAFASRQSGAAVMVAEAAFATGTSDATNATLKAVAAQAVSG